MAITFGSILVQIHWIVGAFQGTHSFRFQNHGAKDIVELACRHTLRPGVLAGMHSVNLIKECRRKLISPPDAAEESSGL